MVFCDILILRQLIDLFKREASLKKEDTVILAYSFGYCLNNPGISNQALAEIVEKVYQATSDPIILQGEIAECVNFKPTLVINDYHIQDGFFRARHLNINEVTDQAIDFMKSKDMSRIWLIVHPFMYLVRCRKLLKNQGFQVLTPKVGKLPFDQKSKQWWTRSLLQLFLYSVWQKFFPSDDF